MKTDIEIAQSVNMKHITEIAKIAGVDDKYLEQYGNYKAKVDLSLLVDFENLNLHHLSDLKVIMNVLYKCVGNLRNMNQAAFPARERDKSAEIHDACYLSLLNTADFNCHGKSAPS